MRLLLLISLLSGPLALAEQPLPVYPGTVHTRIGNDLVIGGELYRLAYFQTADPLQQVARHFEKQWTTDGYPVTVDGDFKEQGVVSAFYTREGLVRSVVLKRHGGETLGFCVLKDLWVREPLAKAAKLPSIEGALFSEDVVLRGEAGGTQSRTSLLHGSIAQARERVAKGFAGKGYSLIRETQVKLDGQPQRVLEFSRGKEQVVVSFVALTASASTLRAAPSAGAAGSPVERESELIALQQTWVGSDRVDAVPNDEAVKAAARPAEGR